MDSATIVDVSNFASFAHMNPYIRYCAEDRYTEPWTLPERIMADYEFILVTHGKGTFTVDGKEHAVKPGDLVLLYPGVPHSAESLTLPFGFLCAHFDLYVTAAKSDFHTEDKWFHETLPSKNIGYTKAVIDFPVHYRMPDPSRLQGPFMRLVNEGTRQGSGFMPLMKACLTEMLITAFRQYRGDRVDFPVHPPEIQSVIDYISNNYTDKITLGGLADMVHFQPSYLSGCFRKRTGRSIIEYITLTRLVKAKELLLTTDRKLEDIAADTGFYDMHHLIKVFKRYEGFTPSQYRQLDHG